MLALSNSGIKTAKVEEGWYWLPGFDIEQMACKTLENPLGAFWCGKHLKGFISVCNRRFLKSKVDSGIIAVETYDPEIIDKIYKPCDNLSLLVLMRPDGSLEKKVVASVAESLVGDSSKEEDWAKLKDIFAKASLQIVSFTITEKGYGLKGISGEYLADVKDDIETGPETKAHHVENRIPGL